VKCPPQHSCAWVFRKWSHRKLPMYHALSLIFTAAFAYATAWLKLSAKRMHIILHSMLHDLRTWWRTQQVIIISEHTPSASIASKHTLIPADLVYAGPVGPSQTSTTNTWGRRA
jgi:hypothetical protein